MLFSQRKGLKPIRVGIQVDGIDTDLRNALWDAIQLAVWDKHEDRSYYGYLADSSLNWLFKLLWHKYFKTPIDLLPERLSEAIARVRKYFFSCEWYEAYDLIEFIAAHASDAQGKELMELSNLIMERELSAYRFIDHKIVQISSTEEVESIEQAIANDALSEGARVHLKAALGLLSDRKSPDYRNSIKESISAVESLAQALTGDPKATLGSALKYLEQGGGMHPALKSSLSSLYGYTSDADGIRHALLEEANLTFTDAKFMLVACTNFVNYMLGKASESGMR